MTGQTQAAYYPQEAVIVSEEVEPRYGNGTMADSEPCGMMGSGAMGSCGMGTMQAGMMGHGMAGRGMMGPGMMGPGMMGQGGMMRGYAMGPIMHLDLSDTQRAQINKIADNLRQQHWSTMGQIMGQQSKLRDLYASDQPDPKQVGDTYGAIAKLRQEMVVAQVKAHNAAVGVLNNDQREQLKRVEHGVCPAMAPTGTASGQQQPSGTQQQPSAPAPTSQAPQTTSPFTAH